MVEQNMPTVENTYAQNFPQLAVEASPEIPAATRLAWINEPLATELGIDRQWLASNDGLAWLTGTPAKDTKTHALAYSGYQFGQLSPVLGDGRAHLIGELPTQQTTHVPTDHTKLSARVDLHLKGSGRTVFSRPGSDGKAPLSAVWREVVIGESLHALGGSTTRALAVLETGESVRRRSPQTEPAGILVRVAASHLRVGTFQYAQMNCENDERAQLVNYALERHYPQTPVGESTSDNTFALLREVSKRQAHLIAQWMSLGFVHGVLNTDNVAISGQAIDFGPCAFIDAFSHEAVYSSIDQHGRYKYRNQPGITQWNLARFCESLLDLLDTDLNRAIHRATDLLAEYEDIYQEACTAAFARKLGISLSGVPTETYEGVATFIENTLDLLEQNACDFTGFFRMLTEDSLETPVRLYTYITNRDTAQQWCTELMHLRNTTNTTQAQAQKLMEASNPIYIPRNLTLEAALRAVEAGNMQPIERLLEAVRSPYTRHQGYEDLESAPAQSRFFRSFCGT